MDTSPRHRRLPDLPAFEPGWVWLVGSGPGDPGLLTLLAHHALAEADVVVYDALVDDSILALAAPEAELVYAGKRGGKPSPKQPDISNRLIALARTGKRILRLKGGDPFVFGRGGEEALALVAAGIPFRVVPGITAGIGGLAYAGIPATHRDANHTVAFITGHMAGGDMPDGIDWKALAAGGQALVIYMALKHLEAIAGQLMGGGLVPETPVAVVSRAATRHQKVLETTLGQAAQDVVESGIEAPAIVAVGEIVRLRAGLDWLGAMEGRQLDSDPLGQSLHRDTA
jgi:uroporphyrin-III C-methyltransferase